MESIPGVTSLFVTVVGAGGCGGGGGGGGASAPASEIYTITSGDKANGIPFQIGISNSTNSKAPTTSTYFKSITEIASAGGQMVAPGA